MPVDFFERGSIAARRMEVLTGISSILAADGVPPEAVNWLLEWAETEEAKAAAARLADCISGSLNGRRESLSKCLGQAAELISPPKQFAYPRGVKDGFRVDIAQSARTSNMLLILYDLVDTYKFRRVLWDNLLELLCMLCEQVFSSLVLYRVFAGSFSDAHDRMMFEMLESAYRYVESNQERLTQTTLTRVLR